MPLSNEDEALSLVSTCRDVAREAGAYVLSHFRANATRHEKEAKDFVTEHDERSQALIVSRLEERHPGVPIIAEEGTDGVPSIPRGLAFVVDPIDGTTNFMHGHPMWCIAIGILLDGEPVAGAIVAPALGWIWSGARGEGFAFATRNGARCTLSTTNELSQSLLATGFPPDRGPHPWNNFGSFIVVKRRARAVRRCGSAALDLAFVADGTYDGYWERRLFLWDAVASSAILLAAGGRITSIDGGPPEYVNGHIVATNGRIHEELVRAVRDGERVRIVEDAT